MITRRLFSFGLLAAPAIIRPGVLMPIKAPKPRFEIKMMPINEWDGKAFEEFQGQIHLERFLFCGYVSVGEVTNEMRRQRISPPLTFGGLPSGSFRRMIRRFG